ncbi:MAG TPA: protein translocase subunit SecD [Actinomycetota bacterium]|nr:protein translocase subunit SecD [Actinomycetota bacterium]
MNKRKYKINLLFSLLLAFGGVAAVVATDTKPKLGLDLEGGISIILAAQGEGVGEEGVLQQTVDIIRQRIDALGLADPQVTAAGEDTILVQLPGLEDEKAALELIGTTAQLTFREVLKEYQPGDEKAPEITQATGSEVKDEEVVYPVEGGEGTRMSLDGARLTGDVVTQAEAVVDTQTGSQWSVSLEMNDEGADEWATFTGEQACQRDEGKDDRIAIVLDDQVVSAPGMSGPDGQNQGVVCDEGIAGGESQIDTGGEDEAKDLALVLRYGALPLELEQQEVQKVSPTLGEDSLQAGVTAGIIGLALVLIYMVIYYRALGFVAWLGLAVFTAILYTIMAVLGSSAGLSLSLAGVAGVIISVGVTADSYIVAFERLKDEVRAGKSVRAAVERGMARSFRTILVADFVTGAAALILFLTAVGPVRGFALTLGLATMIDVFVAYYFTRSAVHVLANARWAESRAFLGLRKAMGAES